MGPFDDEFDDDDTHVGDLPEEVAPEDVVEIVSGEVTKPHDGKEWLHGFRAGHRGLRADYKRAIKLWAYAQGYTADKAEEISQEIDAIAVGTPDPRNKSG